MTEQGKAIEQLSIARRALAEAKSIEEIAHVRGVAEAARHYAKMQGLGLEVVNEAVEMKLRSDRKLGEALAEMKKNKGAATRYQASDRVPPKLSDIGISKNTSSQAQQIAAIPEDDFEQHIAQTVPPARVRGAPAASRQVSVLTRGAKMADELLAIGDDFKVTPTGLLITGEPSVEQWEAVGQQLATVGNALQWAIGDWATYGAGQNDYGERYEQAIQQTGFSYGGIRNLVSICRAFELS